MRVLHVILIVAVVTVVGAVGAAWFEVAEVPVLTEMARGVKGYGLAKTPDECLERYKKALEARNYEMATRFMDGDYAIQLRKQAKVTSRLGKAIDNFRSAAKDRGYINDKVEASLALIEPYPKTISVKDVKADGDKATAIIVAESSSRMIPQQGMLVNLKKTDGIWRLDLPLTTDQRGLLDSIEKYAQDYVNALDSVKTRMKTDATTKENVANDLLDEFVKIDPKWQQRPH